MMNTTARVRSWTIYRLEGTDGGVFYVGATRNPARRLREHKKVLGYRPRMLALEEGSGSFNEAERRWIAFYREAGAPLINKTEGGNGCWSHSLGTRHILSIRGRGRAKPAGFAERLSALTKGQKRNWSPTGEDIVRQTQFKPGHQTTPAARSANIDASRAAWARISKEERSRLATERNRQAWARRSPGERAEIGRKIAAARRQGGNYTTARRADAARRGWSTMSPESKAACVAAMNDGRRKLRENAR